MSIRARLLAVLGATFVVVGLGATVIYFLLEAGHERERNNLAVNLVAAQVVGRIEAAMRAHPRGALEPELLRQLPLAPPLERIILVDARGRVAASTDSRLTGRALSRADEGCRGCHGRQGASSVRLGRGVRWARPLSAETSCRFCHGETPGPLGCLIIDLSRIDGSAQMRREIGGGIALLSTLFLVIGWATMGLTRRWVLLRVDALAKLMERFQAGDLSPRAVVGGRDEIGVVEGGLNRMAEALRARQGETDALVARLSAANEELRFGEERVRRACDSQRVLNDVLRLSHGGQPLAAVLQRALDLVLGIEWLAVETRGSVFVAERGALVLRAQTGLAPELLERCARVPFGTCLCGQAAAQRRLVYTPEAGPDHTTRYEGMPPHGHYCVPILSVEREVLGVLNLYLRPGHAACVEETEFLAAVAATLGGVIARDRATAERERLIGELRHLLDLVSKSRQEWQATFDGITDLISILDSENRIVRVNLAFAAYHGMHPREMVGLPCKDYCLGGHGGADACPLLPAMKGEEGVSEEVVDARTGRIFRLSVFPYASGFGPVNRYVHLAEDVTAARENEQRLILSERLAALGQMASGIAHEINNPLASIAGCAESLMGRLARGRVEAESLREYLEIIHDEVFRCKGITTAMLSFVRGGSYEKGLVRPDAALDRALELIGFQGRLRDVEVVRAYAQRLPDVRASEGELRQVLLIVITNALDAMQERGRLRCGVGAGGGAVVLTICDSGPGIAAEHVARLFTPYFTTKAERGGTGLGLSIAKRIVEDAGGSIAISSATGEGTIVTITLPSV